MRRHWLIPQRAISVNVGSGALSESADVVAGSGAVSGALTPVFSYPSGFAAAHSAFNLCSDANAFSGSQILLCSSTPGAHEAGAAWYNTPVDIRTFTAEFEIQMPTLAQLTAAVGGGAPPANIAGASFTIQNNTGPYSPNQIHPGAAWTSVDANMAGCGAFDAPGQYPMNSSVSLVLGQNPYDQVCYPFGGVPNYMGLFLNGCPTGHLVPFNDINPYGLSFYDGNVISASITYDGSILTAVLTDTVTGAQARQSWPVDIPSVVRANTAYIGWTGGEVPACIIPLNSASYWTGYNGRLATPTFSVSSGSYATAQTVAISGPAGASIYYTTNGLLPTTRSTLYTGPITVSTTTPLQAIAIESGYTDSYVAKASYAIGSTSAPLINYPSGFAANDGIALVGVAALSGTDIVLAPSTATPSGFYNGMCGAAWYPIPVNVATFASHFQLQWTGGSRNGLTFCIQNQPPTSSNATGLYVTGGPSALGGGNQGLGYAIQGGVGYTDYAGILASIAVAFDLYTTPNSVGLYTNGAFPTGSQQATGLNFVSGDIFDVALSYDGTTLALTMTDTTTSASFSYSWPINIPATVGASTAYAGFTGAVGSGNANQIVKNWTM